MRISRWGPAIVLACLVVMGAAACREEADRAAGVEGAAREEFGTSWEAFKRTAHEDLDRVERDLEAARKGLADFERAQVDRWADRVKRAREEIAKEVAEAPEERQRDREKLRGEVDEIKREVAALMEKLRSSKSAPSSGDPGE
jgi:archaellum component FlaC